MQQQRPIQQAQDVITRTQSLQLVQTLVRVSMGCIMYLRDLLPEDAMETKYIRSSADENASDLLSSQIASDSPQGRKVKVINGNASAEAKMMVDYLEVGIFDAIEKEYLQSFVFAIYLDPNDPNNVVETYTFSFSYIQLSGSAVTVPVMNLDTQLSRMALLKKGKERAHDPHAVSSAGTRLPAEAEVRQSVRMMVKKLTANIDAMDQLPRRRFATFKLYFTPQTPADYEPPHFVSVEAEKSRLFFSTHDAEEAPERVSCGSVRSGYHSVDVDVASLASIIPARQDDIEPEDHRMARDEETRRQLRDASDRSIVWSAEVGTGATPDPSVTGGDGLDELHQPIGVRDKDGRLTLGDEGKVKRYMGNVEREPGELDQMNVEERDGLMETQPITTAVDPSSLIRDIDTLQLGDMIFNELQQSMDIDHLTPEARAVLESRSTAREGPPASGPPSDNRMDLDGDPTRLNSDGRSSEQRRAHLSNNQATGPVSAESGPASLEPISEESEDMKCTCEDPAEDGGTIYCDAGCGGVYHLWCMGYMSPKDKRLPDNFVCWMCKLSQNPQFAFLSECDKVVTFSKLKELSLMRRALQVLHQEEVPQTKQLWSARLGCEVGVANLIMKRLVSEGFLGDEAAVREAILMEETQASIVTTRSGKKVIPKVVKSKKVKALAKKSRMMKIWTSTTKAQSMKYFQPGGSMEKDILGAARLDVISALKESQLHQTSQRLALVDDNVASCSQAPNAPKSHPDVIPSQHVNTPFPARHTSSHSSVKRKSNDENNEPRKKPRMAMALQSVGLEQDFD
ncbi:DNA binding protein [Tulasnella sp. 330]|nr:DNA binding protein [Tulasnella sp. 330]KAG8879888.1 DNA binding protein [Tulasnella sp. 331]